MFKDCNVRDFKGFEFENIVLNVLNFYSFHKFIYLSFNLTQLCTNFVLVWTREPRQFWEISYNSTTLQGIHYANNLMNIKLYNSTEKKTL